MKVNQEELENECRRLRRELERTRIERNDLNIELQSILIILFS